MVLKFPSRWRLPCARCRDCPSARSSLPVVVASNNAATPTITPTFSPRPFTFQTQCFPQQQSTFFAPQPVVHFFSVPCAVLCCAVLRCAVLCAVRCGALSCDTAQPERRTENLPQASRAPLPFSTNIPFTHYPPPSRRPRPLLHCLLLCIVTTDRPPSPAKTKVSQLRALGFTSDGVPASGCATTAAQHIIAHTLPIHGATLILASHLLFPRPATRITFPPSKPSRKKKNRVMRPDPEKLHA